MTVKDLTDAELVEAVARDVLGFDIIEIDGLECWYREKDESPKIFGRKFIPFTDMNDLLMVLERFEGWELSYSVTMSRDGHKMYWCVIFDNKGGLAGVAHNIDKARAVLEACLTAERGKG